MVDAHVGQMATTIVLWLWFIGWAIALARLDIREHRLPNRMVAICFAGCVIATLVHAVVVANVTALVTPAIASLAAATCFLIGHVTGGIGMGDVKFALVTGWMLGTISWSAVWWGMWPRLSSPESLSPVGGCCAGGGASIPSRSDPLWASV